MSQVSYIEDKKPHSYYYTIVIKRYHLNLRVLITGAAGFYGSHLVNNLLRKDDTTEIIGVDSFDRKKDFPLDPFDIVDDKRAFEERFTILASDFRDLDATKIDSLQVDCVIHLAALVSIPESMVKPREYFEVNEQGTFKLTQELLKSKTQPSLIFASSPEVYGDPIYTPLDMNHPFRPRSFYAVSKLAGERHCMVMHEWYGYPVTIIRNFNTYGENQSNTYRGYPAVIPEFITKSILNEPIVIEGNGKQTRDLMYVKDAVSAYVRVIEMIDKCKGEIFDIGTGVQTSIIDLANKIIDISESSSELRFASGRPAELERLEADTSRIKEVLEWSPSHTLEKGLVKTIPWYRLVLENAGKANRHH